MRSEPTKTSATGIGGSKIVAKKVLQVFPWSSAGRYFSTLGLELPQLADQVFQRQRSNVVVWSRPLTRKGHSGSRTAQWGSYWLPCST